jgi:hypothetical protein
MKGEKSRFESKTTDLAQDVLERALGIAQWESRRTCQKLHFQNRCESLAQSHGLTHGTVIEWDDAATFAQVEEISPESPHSGRT